MRKGGLPTVAWVLAGLLAIAGGLMTLGQQDPDSDPRTASYGPSGVSAFAELLRQNGIPVVIDMRSRPRLNKNDIAVAFHVQGDSDGQFIINSEAKTPKQIFDEQFWSFVKGGGAGIVLPLSKDFMDASRKTKTTPFVEVTQLSNDRKFRVTSSGTTGDQVFDAPEDDSTYVDLWHAGNDAFLRGYSIGDGKALIVRDGIGITNRFVDKEDNAQAFMAMISMLGKNRRVVFTEASFGNVNDPGLLQAIGSWANAAWQQLIVLGLVIVFTLGKRFGTPDEVKLPQRGSRELLDGLADTFRRSRQTQAALSTALRVSDNELRLVLKLPRDATRVERDRLIPESLKNALMRLQVAAEYPNVTEDHALDLIVKAQAELDEFIGPNRAKLRSLAKLRT